MCGLCGVAGNVTKGAVEVFNDLLYISALRGYSSTGVASQRKHVVDKGKQFDVTLLKQVGGPWNLLGLKKYDQATDWPAKFVIGHTRSPTVGKVTDANAHPFVFEKVVGAHNGTIWPEALKRLAVDDYDSDSEGVFSSINNIGIEETVSKLSGAWALTFWDRRQETINFLRNKERPLYYAFTEDHTQIFWASEIGFLHAAFNRPNRVVPIDKIYMLPEDTLISFEIPRAIGKPIGEARRKALKGFTWERPIGPKVHSSAPLGGTRSDKEMEDLRAWMTPGPHRNPSQTFVHSKTIPSSGRVFDFPKSGEEYRKQQQAKEPTLPGRAWTKEDEAGLQAFLKEDAAKFEKDNLIMKGSKAKYFRGYNGELMNRDQFLKATTNGCGWCTQAAEWPERGKPEPIRFVALDAFLCGHCMKDKSCLEACGLLEQTGS